MSTQPTSQELATEYPWHAIAWQRINALRGKNRLPHALLITGGAGMGLSQLALRLAHSLLCDRPTEEGAACGECHPCRLFESENHPEFSLTSPESDSQVIKVDQIRDLIRFSQLQARISQRKIVVIDPAEKMNESAANSLLKTLEEPVGETHLILVTHQPAQLPITIRSRCQQISIDATVDNIRQYLQDDVPDQLLHALLQTDLGPLYLEEYEDVESLDSLRQCLSEDLLSLKLKQADPLLITKNWTQFQTKDVCFWLIKTIEDTVKLKLADNLDVLTNPDKIEFLKNISETTDIKTLYKFYDDALDALKLCQGKSNIKAETVFEEITISWTRAT